MGMINCGNTDNILVSPFYNNSSHPLTAKNLYGSSVSLNPSKKIGR